MAEIAPLDDWVSEVLTTWGISGRTAFKARLCITEVVTNTIENADANLDDDIAVTLSRVAGNLQIEIVDRSQPFDPGAYILPAVPSSLDAIDGGGNGLRLFQAYARNIHYETDGRLNRLQICVPCEHARDARSS